MPKVCIPKTITKIPAIFFNMANFERKKLPKKVAEAPKHMKINEKPRTKNKALINTVRVAPDSDVWFRISSNDNPEIKLRYAGIRGKIQGDRKEINPAEKAVKKEIFSI